MKHGAFTDEEEARLVELCRRADFGAAAAADADIRRVGKDPRISTRRSQTRCFGTALARAARVVVGACLAGDRATDARCFARESIRAGRTSVVVERARLAEEALAGGRHAQSLRRETAGDHLAQSDSSGRSIDAGFTTTTRCETSVFELGNGCG